MKVYVAIKTYAYHYGGQEFDNLEIFSNVNDANAHVQKEKEFDKSKGFNMYSYQIQEKEVK